MFSLPGLLILALLLAGLGVTLWRQGGLAFSPGALSARKKPGVLLNGYGAHADFEKECRYCHQPLTHIQGDLCMSCHQDISEQLVLMSGLHGVLENVQMCFKCHSDHRGSEFDPRKDAYDNFDHAVTRFSLIWHQVNYSATPLDCAGCHLDNEDFKASAQNCIDCHGKHNTTFMVQHLADFGENCFDCHDGTDRMASFDHSSTSFPLEGSHQTVRCVECHIDGNFQNLALECGACHLEPAIHQGSFGSDCATCHNSEAWKPANLNGKIFDHANQSGFSLTRHKLDYAGQTLECQACHPGGIDQFTGQTCIECHAEHDQVFMTEHISQFGEYCLDCHDGFDRMSNFNHADFFPLEGRHAELGCESCHAGKTFQGVPKDCVGCHREPEIHAGIFGLQCQDCHTADRWRPAKLRSHTFPLDHGNQSEVACQVCHPKSYVEYTCYGCHDHQPQPIEESHRKEGVSLDELANCVACHQNGG